MNWKKHKLPALLMLMIVVYSCASMGTPDGGPYDAVSYTHLRAHET